MKNFYENCIKKKMNKKMVVIGITITLLSILIINNSFVVKAIEQINVKEENEESKITINQEIEKYVKLENGQTLLQEKICVEMEDFKEKEYEIIKEKAPKIQNQFPESTIVLLNGNKIDESLYKYKPESGEIEITIKKENNIEYWRNEKEEYKIIYKYKNLDITEENIILDTEIITKLENTSSEIKNKNTKDIKLIESGENVSISGKMTNEIYKGYIYENEENETTFNEIYNVEISNKEDVNEIFIKNGETYFMKDNSKKIDVKGNICFKSTKILKDDMLNILGEKGTITIKNENGDILSVINKDTKEDEYGIIEITYNEKDVKNLEITTTNPINEGSLKIVNSKAILPNTEYSKKELKECNKLKQQISANESNYEIESNLLDTTLQADFNVNKTELSTMMENQEIEIKTILKSYNNTMDLYENPTIKITLPEEIEEITLKEEPKILYNEELKIKNINIEKNEINIQLEGNQTKYNEEAIEGTVIDLIFNVKLNKEATNAKKSINMIVQNQNKEINLEKEINIISPKEIISLNNIKELGIETYGIEEDSIINIDRKDKKKQISINSQIINNKEKEISKVKVIGEFPTNGERQVRKNKIENNLNLELNSKINIEGKECKIYYTENNNATEELDNVENGWQENFDELTNVKKYMIIINKIAQNEKIEFNYKATIPENLDYNQQAIEGYRVIYDNEETQSEEVIESTYIEMTTGKGPVIEGDLKGFIGEKEIVENTNLKAGEEITYKINLRNTGTEDSENAKISLDIPTGMYYKKDKSKRNLELDLGNIKANENKNINIGLVVDENLAETKSIESKVKIKYKDIEKETNIIKYNIVPSEIIGKIEMITNNETTFIEGDIIEYRATVKNNSNEKLENIKFKWNIPEFCKINSQSILGKDNWPETNFKPDEIINIKSLEPKESVKISLFVSIGEVVKENEKLVVGATIEKGENKYIVPSSEEMPVYSMNNFEISMEANNENGFVESGEEIIYKIFVINKNTIKATPIILDKIPEQLKINEITINGEEPKKGEIEEKENNNIYIHTEFQAGEKKTITIKTLVNKKELAVQDEQIENKAILTTEKQKRIESNSVKHIISRKNDNENNNNNGPNENNKEEYKINGIVWEDTSKDGILDNQEKRLKDIEVFLMNVKTNKIEVDENGNAIKTKTLEDGSYILSNIKEGEYLIVFKYDNTKYKITTYKAEGISEEKTSKAINKKMNIEGTDDIYGVTDTIKVLDKNISNINMGLIETEKFDLKLDKYIKNVKVENSAIKNIYDYKNTQLAKVELDAKEINNTKLTIEYNIVISNQGEIPGYIKNVVDYIPKGFSFNKEKNKGWYEKEGNLYNESLANEKLNPGEAKIITLTLEKNTNEKEMGTYSNLAEIKESYNELGIQDINSKEGNKKEGENDISTASIIISIKTGESILYITLIISCVLIIAVGIVFIKKKVLNIK